MTQYLVRWSTLGVAVDERGVADPAGAVRLRTALKMFNGGKRVSVRNFYGREGGAEPPLVKLGRFSAQPGTEWVDAGFKHPGFVQLTMRTPWHLAAERGVMLGIAGAVVLEMAGCGPPGLLGRALGPGVGRRVEPAPAPALYLQAPRYGGVSTGGGGPAPQRHHAAVAEAIARVQHGARGAQAEHRDALRRAVIEHEESDARGGGVVEAWVHGLRGKGGGEVLC